MPVRILRAVGVAAVVVAAGAALTSCSQSGAAPGGADTAPAAASAAPSAAAPTPTESVASDTPAPVATPVVTIAPTGGADARTVVFPAITTKDWDAAAKALDVSAIVPGIVEGGGTCKVTVTAGATTRTATSTSVAAGSYTGCPAVAIHDLAAGSWQVTVRYSSSTSVGSSKPATVVVG